MKTKSLEFRALKLAIVLGALTSTAPVKAQYPSTQVPLNEPTGSMLDPVEIYYGVKKVSPVASPVPEQAILQTSATVNSSNPDSFRISESISEVMHEVSGGIRNVSTAMSGLIHSVADKEKIVSEPRQFIAMAVPSTTATMPSSQPQVVVIREPAETHQVLVPSEGTTFNATTILAFAIGLVGLVFSLMSWARSSSKKEQIVVPSRHLAPVPLDPNGIQLMGKYNAGPKPETAEKFEIGPTYHEQLQQKKLDEETNNSAAVELILNQNLALLVEMNPGDAVTAVHTDDEGFALAADKQDAIPAIA